MPNVNWEEFAEIKHFTSACRTMNCASWLHLTKVNKKLKDPLVIDTIHRLKIFDKRLDSFENYLVSLILKYDADNGGKNEET